MVNAVPIDRERRPWLDEQARAGGGSEPLGKELAMPTSLFRFIVNSRGEATLALFGVPVR